MSPLPPPPPIADTAARPGEVFSELLPWLLVLLGIVVAGAIILHFLRRSLSAGTRSDAGFSLRELRALRDAGELSDEEFERARSALVARVRGETSENTEAAREESESRAREDDGPESASSSRAPHDPLGPS